MKRAYTALHSETDHDNDLVTALKWARDQATDDQPVTLWCAHQDSLPQGWENGLQRAGVAVVTERPRRRGETSPRRFPGPLVAVGFTTLHDVIDVEPFEHPMCLVGAYDPRNDEGFSGLTDHPHVRWIEAFEPDCLSGPPIELPDSLIEDPVIAKAMESFTSITYKGRTMYDSRDGGRVTDGLMLLHSGGHLLDHERLFSAALRDGWKGSEALRLRAIGQEVARGVRKRPSERLGPGALERWRAEANM